MNIQKINPNIKYLYHYTLKKNVEKILNDKAIKSKDQYVFFTKSLNDSILAFEREMMQENKLYIDVNGVLKKREKCNKDDYCILKIPYINDNEFYKFNFENQKKESIYTLSITHKGNYKFKNAKVLEFPKYKKLNVLSKTAVATIVAGIMLFPYNTYAASWLDSGNYDISWYSETSYIYHINTAKKVAGLAHLVNNENKSFAGKEIYIDADVDLTQNTWETIKDIFQGAICGSHRIILNYLDGQFVKGRYIEQAIYPIKVLENNKNLINILVSSPYTVGRLKYLTGAQAVFLNNKELSDDTKSLFEIGLQKGDIIDVFTSPYIYIQNPKGIKTPLYFESGDSIEKTIESYSNVVNIPKEKIILKYNDRELEIGKTLADYNIQKFVTVNAYVKYNITASVEEGEGSIASSKNTALPGEGITITLNPNSKYELSKLMVNETEKTSEVQNNQLEIECGEKDIDVRVSYKLKQQEEPKDDTTEKTENPEQNEENKKDNIEDKNEDKKDNTENKKEEPKDNVETEKNENQNNNETISNPETGDNIIMYIITSIISIIGLVICKCKKIIDK